jgi:glycerol-3-phosphate O-acyltransferase
MPGITEAPPVPVVSAALQRSIQEHLDRLDDDGVHAYLADAVYEERRRFAHDRDKLTDADLDEQRAVEAAARCTRGDRAAVEGAVLGLVDRYAHEIHNLFSQRTHKMATGVIPGALTRLLTSAHPAEWLGHDFDPASRIAITGDQERLRRLAEDHTLILAPTHLSNLDSPILGYALHQSGLPPFIYGAGLNLFGNKLMGFFMSRLGAYTVDRRKRHSIYKDTLKAYSVDALGRRCHSLFFPGGTRARSGRVESSIKKGLLGTGIVAWQEGLERGRPNPEILVVPCTLSFALVLEAETLIEDALQAEGRSRYIITDDEFSQPRTVASFARRVLNLDASAHVHLGDPLDLMGNPVDEDGRSLDPNGHTLDRRRYVTDRAGAVVRDPQRDRVYTDHLAQGLVDAWHRDTVALSTHVAGFAAWGQLQRAHPRMDTWQLVFLAPDERRVARVELLFAIERVLEGLDRLQAAGQIRAALPGSGAGRAEAVLDQALDRFARFHTRRALERCDAERLRVDTRLALYYGNRLQGFGLDGAARSVQHA